MGDERVDRPNVNLTFPEQLLMQLLPTAQAGELNRNRRRGAYQLGYVEDSRRFSHIEDEGLTITPDAARSNNEMHRLGNRHEVASRVRMSYRNWSTRFDLSGEGV